MALHKNPGTGSVWPGDNRSGVLPVGLPFPQVASGDLDVSIVGQQPPPNLSFGNEFEPRPVKVVGFDAAFRCGSHTKQDLEHAPGNPHHTLILPDPDAEFDNGAGWIPAGVRGETEKHASPEMFCECSNLAETLRTVQCLGL
jgi:hypothetical protein